MARLEALRLLPLQHLIQSLRRLGWRLEARGTFTVLALASRIERDLLTLALAGRAPAQLVLGHVVGDFEDPGLELRLGDGTWGSPRETLRKTSWGKVLGFLLQRSLGGRKKLRMRLSWSLNRRSKLPSGSIPSLDQLDQALAGIVGVRHPPSLPKRQEAHGKAGGRGVVEQPAVQGPKLCMKVLGQSEVGGVICLPGPQANRDLDRSGSIFQMMASHRKVAKPLQPLADGVLGATSCRTRVAPFH